MTTKEIRRLMARQLDPATVRESERNERIALETWRICISRGTLARLGLVR